MRTAPTTATRPAALDSPSPDGRCAVRAPLVPGAPPGSPRTPTGRPRPGHRRVRAHHPGRRAASPSASSPGPAAPAASPTCSRRSSTSCPRACERPTTTRPAPPSADDGAPAAGAGRRPSSWPSCCRSSPCCCSPWSRWPSWPATRCWWPTPPARPCGRRRSTTTDAARRAAERAGPLAADRLDVEVTGRDGVGSRVRVVVRYPSPLRLPLIGASVGDVELAAPRPRCGWNDDRRAGPARLRPPRPRGRQAQTWWSRASAPSPRLVQRVVAVAALGRLHARRAAVAARARLDHVGRRAARRSAASKPSSATPAPPW